MDKLKNKMSIFTPEDFHDEEELIAKTAELFIKQDVAPNISAIEQHQYDVTRQLLKKAGEHVYLKINNHTSLYAWRNNGEKPAKKLPVLG